MLEQTNGKLDIGCTVGAVLLGAVAFGVAADSVINGQVKQPEAAQSLLDAKLAPLDNSTPAKKP